MWCGCVTSLVLMRYKGGAEAVLIWYWCGVDTVLV